MILTENRTEEEALEIIEEIKSRVSVENFAELAKTDSEGPSGPSGGDLGWFGKGVMVPEFEAAAFALEVGVVSDPVKSPFGYHLILVEDQR